MRTKRYALPLCLLACIFMVFSAYAEGLPAEPKPNTSVHTSEGTGGTQWRGDEPILYPDLDFADSQQRYLTCPARLSLPDAPEMEAQINAWLKQYDTAPDGGSFTAEVYRGWDTAENLLTLEIRDAKRLFHDLAVFDLHTQKQLRLSDVFCDGFNYIAYINRYIAENMDDALGWFGDEYNEEPWAVLVQTEAGSDQMQMGDGALSQRVLKRPFGGFPADYSTFCVRGNMLLLYISEENPHFIQEIPGYGNVYLNIPLTPDISPFGGRHITRTVRKEPFAGGFYTAISILHISGQENADQVTENINRSMAELYQDVCKQSEAVLAAFQERDVTITPDPYFNVLLEPNLLIYGDVISVTFGTRWYDDYEAPYSSAYVSRAGLYSLRTGEPIDPLPIIQAYGAHPDTLFAYENDIFTEYDTLDAPIPYTLTEDTLFTDAWYLSSRLRGSNLYLRIQEPTGRTLRMIIPMSEETLQTYL